MYNISKMHNQNCCLYTTCNRLQNKTSWKSSVQILSAVTVFLVRRLLYRAISWLKNWWYQIVMVQNDQLRKECSLWRYTNYYNYYFWINIVPVCILKSFPHFQVQYTNIFYMLLHNIIFKMTITDYSSGNNTRFKLHF